MRTFRNLTLAGLMMALLVMTGCWASKFTLISPDQAKVDPAFCGDWSVVNPSGDKASMAIRNIDGKLFYIDTRGAGEDKADRYVGFTAEVKGVTFAHVRPLPEDGSIGDDWMLMRIMLSSDQLVIQQLEPEFFKDKTIESAAQLREVIEKNLNNQAMYTEKETLTATRVPKTN